MKVYLDNDVVSDLARRRVPIELAAMEKIRAIEKQGKLILVTSEVTRREFNRAGLSKPEIERVYASLQRVPLVEAHVHTGESSCWDESGGGWSTPIFEDEPSWLRLLKLGIRDIDAHHIIVAIKTGCAIFLTRDGKTILNRKSEVEAEFPIRLYRPSEFLSQAELL